MDGYRCPIIAWHLQLQVRVMGYCHEFGKRRSAEDGMVLRFPVNYFKLDFFLPEVARRAENYVQRYFAEGISGSSRYDAMESCIGLF